MHLQVSSEWREKELWWRINDHEISDRDLRAWVYKNMADTPFQYVDVIHVEAYAASRLDVTLDAAQTEKERK